MDKPNFEVIRHDVTQEFFIEVDQIYNMACPASPVHYQYNPVKTMKTSILGTMNMLGLAKRVKARILQVTLGHLFHRGDVTVMATRAACEMVKYSFSLEIECDWTRCERRQYGRLLNVAFCAGIYVGGVW